ncbi:EamA domain-containing membrane protein RarD [Spirosomataceae bacterium TFI 002]|nr:EamA domain-containing membrane protein RarD [Spirosomataceae bacterium TFI 002]
MTKKTNWKFLGLGFIFIALWSSASVAAKLGLKSVQPFVLYQARFTLAAFIMLSLVYIIRKGKVPKKSEFKQLALFGFLNITCSLGLFVLAIQEVAAGIGALQVAINPLVITLMSALFLKSKVLWTQILGLFVALAGVAVAVYPLLETAHATPKGLVILALSILSYSSAAIYYSKVKWNLSTMTINAWQALFGALFLLPITFYFYEDVNTFDLNFAFSALWLGIPLSVIAVFLWLYLLKIDTIKASYFLFLSPVFGFIYAYFILNEPFTLYTAIGLVFVLIGIYLGQKKGRFIESTFSD